MKPAHWKTKFDGHLSLIAKLAVETVAVAPLGALWSHWRAARPHLPGGIGAALASGAGLGLVIELGQLTLASGQSQGISVLTRAIGFALGAAIWRARAGLLREAVRAAIRRWSWPLFAANTLLLVVLAGSWRGPWIDLDAALRRLGEDVRFVPFYYHYYTTEMAAVVSVCAISLSYAPIWLPGLGLGFLA